MISTLRMAHLPTTGLLTPNTLLVIPHMLVNTTSSTKIIPDSELVYSPSAVDFDVEAYVNEAGGYLSRYKEWLGTTEWTTGAEIVQRIATENSINPRLLLALIEYQSGWVYGQPSNAETGGLSTWEGGFILKRIIFSACLGSQPIIRWILWLA